MGIGKQGSPCRQLIQIGRFDLRMATEATDPVIEVVNGKKQNILFFASAPVFITKAKKNENKTKMWRMDFIKKGFYRVLTGT